MGSFTVDGMTFALSGDGATLVAVAPGASGPSEVPSTVSYGDAAYDVVAIGAFAFYLSGATSVALPETVSSVDEQAFRSSDVAWVEVDPANPNYASFDGILYDASLTRLLLIPGGRQGAVRISDKAEGVEAPAFSHCAGVNAVSVDAGSASFASWDGLLYDASGTTLLRVPAGAADITIREGCTAIAAGAMEGCAKLESASAPSTVTSISPDVFSSVPTVSLPASTLAKADDGAIALDGTEEDKRTLGSEVPNSPRPPSPSSAEAAALQLTTIVALASEDDSQPVVDPGAITVALDPFSEKLVWRERGFTVIMKESLGISGYGKAATYSNPAITANMNGGTFRLRSNGKEYSSYTFNEAGIDFNWDSIWNISGTYLGDNFKRVGYECQGWSSSPTSGAISKSIRITTAGIYYARWAPNPYAIELEPQGGTPAGPVSATYDADVTLPASTRAGYAFAGWDTEADGTGTRYQANVALKKPNLATSGTAKLYAQWTPVIAVDVPTSVTARVDLLGIEEQQEASGYIRSLCGEPLRVEAVECASRPGASALFGSWVDQVRLEVSPGAAGGGSVMLDLGADGFVYSSTAPASLTSFLVGSYGDELPVTYRFAIPSGFPLASLPEGETEACRVSYTVALA